MGPVWGRGEAICLADKGIRGYLSCIDVGLSNLGYPS